MTEKNFTKSLTELNTLLSYLQNRPFKEVVSLIGILNSVSKVEHKNTIKNTTEKTKQCYLTIKDLFIHLDTLGGMKIKEEEKPGKS